MSTRSLHLAAVGDLEHYDLLPQLVMSSLLDQERTGELLAASLTNNLATARCILRESQTIEGFEILMEVPQQRFRDT